MLITIFFSILRQSLLCYKQFCNRKILKVKVFILEYHLNRIKFSSLVFQCLPHILNSQQRFCNIALCINIENPIIIDRYNY